MPPVTSTSTVTGTASMPTHLAPLTLTSMFCAVYGFRANIGKSDGTDRRKRKNVANFFAYRRSQSSGFWGCRPDQSWKWNWFSPPMVSTAPSRSPVLTLSPALTVTFRSLQ